MIYKTTRIKAVDSYKLHDLINNELTVEVQIDWQSKGREIRAYMLSYCIFCTSVGLID